MGAADQLLFGLLALQNGLVDQSQLVAAFHAWTRDKARSLADHLEAIGHLDDDQRAAVDMMVALHLRRHGGDPEKSLAEIPAGHSTRDRLAELGDPQIDATLRFAVSLKTSFDVVTATVRRHIARDARFSSRSATKNASGNGRSPHSAPQAPGRWHSGSPAARSRSAVSSLIA